MEEFQVLVVDFRVVGGIAAFLTHVSLVASLLIGETTFNAVQLAFMRLKRTTLCESFVALAALERLHSCECNNFSFKT